MKMTKESIISIYNNINRVEGERPYNDPLKWNRFRSCNAYLAHEPITVPDENGEEHLILVVKSYNTKVAFYDYTTHCFCEIGKFSRTTSKQCTQIFNTHFVGADRVNAMHYIAW